MRGNDDAPAADNTADNTDVPKNSRHGGDAVVLAFHPPKTASNERLLREVIGPVLREERLDQGRTLADVAESAAVSLPYLSEVERGTKEASSTVLRAITSALGVDTAEVLERCADRLRIEMSSSSFTCLAA